MNAVSITYFLANGSVDDILWPMIRTKMKVLGEVVEGNAGLDMVVHKEDPVRRRKVCCYGHSHSHMLCVSMHRNK